MCSERNNIRPNRINTLSCVIPKITTYHSFQALFVKGTKTLKAILHIVGMHWSINVSTFWMHQSTIWLNGVNFAKEFMKFIDGTYLTVEPLTTKPTPIPVPIVT